MTTKLEGERIARQRAESRLLETEKKKSEQSVDLGQLESQVNTFKQDLKCEVDKVSSTVGG